MSRVIIIGPGHPLRGGLATFNQRLAKEFIQSGYECSICSFSLQYPRLFFPGKSQYTNEPAPEGLVIRSLINSINPFNWSRVGHKLKNEKPDIIIVRFWIPVMGPALGTILRIVKKNGHTKIICIADNVIPHEHRPGDRTFTRYFLKSCDAFITMSEKVMADLRQFQKEKPGTIVQHPLYDNFGDPVPKKEARDKLGLSNDEKIILFFGFIRQYKGLDILLQAMADERIRQAGIRLMIAGEFYEDKRQYYDLIDQLRIKDQLILRTDFIPDSEVRYYLCAADAVIQPYRNATQSGVTPLAYHFERPMVVTNVGGLASLVPHEKVGLVADPNPKSIAGAIARFYQLGENYFIPHLRTEKQKYSWANLVNAVEALAGK
ncbi:MAG TPA: glycosyltransferase [Chitinophagaceae bacterium]|nr:glycosyltransferase [Chitinophagaceae bacterium]